MSFPSFEEPATWVGIVSLAAHLAAGIVLGAAYFRGLWWQVRTFADGGRLRTTIALIVGRFALLAGALTLTALEGTLPLLLTAFGVLVARFSVMRRVREVAP